MYLVDLHSRSTESDIPKTSDESAGHSALSATDFPGIEWKEEGNSEKLGLYSISGFACGPIIAATLNFFDFIETSSVGAVMVSAGLVAGGVPLGLMAWKGRAGLARRFRWVANRLKFRQDTLTETPPKSSI